jgi:lipid A oxidase
VVAFTLALAVTGIARAELALTLQLGTSWVAESDVAVDLGASDFELFDVTWDARPFEGTMYYGVRLTRWLPQRPAWGIGLDYTHAKAHLEVDEDVRTAGHFDGAAVDGVAPVRETIQELSFAHGLNLVTLNGFRRWQTPPPPGRHRSRGIDYYLGLGAGVAIPHVDATVDGVPTRGYDFGGLALRGSLGIDVAVDDHFSVVGEGTLSWVHLEVDLGGGGSLATELLVPQLTFGLALRN